MWPINKGLTVYILKNNEIMNLPSYEYVSQTEVTSTLYRVNIDFFLLMNIINTLT
jgi:hypothetical protein